MMRMSASSYDRFRTCPRLYYWESVVGFVRVRQDGPRRFGTMTHAGLDAWWLAMDGGDVPWRDVDLAFVKTMQAVAESARKHHDTDRFEVARVEAMLTAYHQRYFELNFQSVLPDGGTEVWFEMPLFDSDGVRIDGWSVVGRADALKRFADGRPKAVEHKTTAQEIHPGADYWKRLAVDIQAGIYVEAARFLGFPDVREVMYDVLRKPALKPLLATPEEKRKMTKGKGCPQCGGRAGGKGGAAKGTGRIMIRTKVDGEGRALPSYVEVETDCTSCAGTGWHEPPRLQSNQRTEDEDPGDFRVRVAEELIDDPNAYFRMAAVTRNDDQIAELREDLRITSGEIGALIALAQRDTEGPADVRARRCFPRNTSACTSIHGRRCDFLDVCSGAVDPWESTLYQIRRARRPASIVHVDERGIVGKETAEAPE